MTNAPEEIIIVNNKTESKLSVSGAIIFGAMIIAGAIFFTRGDFTNSAPKKAVNSQVQAVDIKKVKTEGEPYIGSISAPVTIAYWADYQCPFCKRTEQNVIYKIATDYVNSGKVRIIFKDFQFLGQDSYTIALAGRAIWDLYPDKYYAWHEAMFNNQGQEGSGWATKEKIFSITKTISGIDTGKVEKLMTSKQNDYLKIIEADKTEGQGFGITGTPGMIIDSEVIQGSQDYSVYKQILDSMLK